MQRPLLIVEVAHQDPQAGGKTAVGVAENAVLAGHHHARLLCKEGDFARSLGEIASRFPGRDIVLLSPDVELPFAWDARLQKAAYADARIGAVVPLCDASPLHALVDEELRETSRGMAGLVDRTVYCVGTRSYYEVPRLHSICAYLRRESLDAAWGELVAPVAGAQGFVDALTQPLRSRGWSCVLCDFLYVGCAQSRIDASSSTPGLEASAFAQHHPLGGLRRAVNDIIRSGLPVVSTPGLDHRPVQLHIMHYWGGGSDKWIRDFGRADTSRVNMVFASYRIGENGGQRLILYSDPAAAVPIRVWDIAQPIKSTVSRSIEYRRILEQIVREFNVEAILVSSLIGHALDALTMPVKTLVVCHDFYPICQAINPQFGKTCERCTLDDLRRCARSNPLNSFFPDVPSEEWHAMRTLYVDHLLAHRIELVAPSPSVATTLRRLAPRLGESVFHLIPHGSDSSEMKLPIARREATQPLRLVVLGRLIPRKGAQLLRESGEALKPFAEITLVGCGEEGTKLAEQFGWKAIERYELNELPDLIRSLAPHAGLLLSVVPESFSYTLSELRSFAVPPIATRLGAFVDRIADGETGFLFEPEPEGLLDIVRRLHGHPGELERVATNLTNAQRGRTTGEMVADYHALIALAPRPVARFEVGVGQETALTEPYRHLSEAYAHLTGAYADLERAYGRTTEAYQKTRDAYEDALKVSRAAWEEFGREYDALELPKRWWRAPRALHLIQTLRTTLQASKARASLGHIDAGQFPWAEKLSPRLLKSPWWIGHIPFAFELIARQAPRVIVELGTYSGSSFAAFCQAVEACGLQARCYGIDLWEGDIHMGKFDEDLFQEISRYVASSYPEIATLMRQDFNAAAARFEAGSVDLLHIDGTHTYEAVSNDFHTWLPKMSDRGVVLFHDVNVTVENTGPASLKFGVRRVFDRLKTRYPHLEFSHCWGLGVLVVGKNAPAAVMELVELSRAPGFADYFAAKGAQVSRRFEEMGVKVPTHGAYSPTGPAWRRTVSKLHGYSRRLLEIVRPT